MLPMLPVSSDRGKTDAVFGKLTEIWLQLSLLLTGCCRSESGCQSHQLKSGDKLKDVRKYDSECCHNFGMLCGFLKESEFHCINAVEYRKVVFINYATVIF